MLRKSVLKFGGSRSYNTVINKIILRNSEKYSISIQMIVFNFSWGAIQSGKSFVKHFTVIIVKTSILSKH